ncbi:putative urea ABC transporter substrate-binding protein [Acanthopleuribacter pedis]|uniref:ABC transporter substrate-binding protein n=1 Tax=Acanthopleuribacter pedis TaxID=442870 RepID=A0A8J7QAL4_9BACT|nr:putative urea ABC transporter substrate-binding protein [Acanthopleuribacter pedis]MBO1317261.1 ABC transporter substrate-binding protein [Acanthopleuribacter pedis]MBO1318568.1 ABC transporter substrate-binding protein [Acanthopleuribacter pedis]
MSRLSAKSLLRCLMMVCLVLFATATPALAKTKFKVAWSIYVGWMPWPYAEESGILKKWADAHNIEIELVQMDYVASIEAYVAGQVDACVMTNMEMLNMPAASGIDSTALIIGDYSNGNDALLVRDGLTAKTIKGQEISLVELTVSHYLLNRFLEKNNMKEKDVRVINTSDSDIGPIFLSNDSQKAVVTWNPIVMQIEQHPGITKLFSSADVPGEIIDLMAVNTKTLKKNPALGKALVGAWYEVMSVMSRRGADADKALGTMAAQAESSLVEFKSQLKTTAMFYTADAAVQYASGPEIKKNMDYVRQFCFRHGLLGEGAESADVVGIQYPDGSVQGDKRNVNFRFDVSYMKMAAEGKLKR